MSAAKQMRAGASKRTATERAAINARCKAWLRPRQVEALAALAKACSGAARQFVRSVAGYHAPDDSVHAFSTQTIESLRRRGLAKRWRNAVVITAAGRLELRNYR